jgi:hypothetical protein
VSPITIISDAPSCGFTYDCQSADSVGIIFDRNMFKIQATVEAHNRIFVKLHCCITAAKSFIVLAPEIILLKGGKRDFA